MLCVMLGSCATGPSPFAIALPNGYYLQPDRSEQPALAKRNGSIMLEGPIAAYAVYRGIVTGCVGQRPSRPAAYPNEVSVPGCPDGRYFVLDTATGRLEKNLDEASWKARLQALGVPASVEITAPILPG